jgi:NAD-dependent dihydropyrimidine dehydrogenase PreA subunit
MKRRIININHELCTGCGNCIPDCPEGALQLIDGKARLVSDLFCDGLGACVGACPTGAMTIEEREAEPYNESKVMENIVKQGDNVIRAHLIHLKDHGEEKLLSEAISYLSDKGFTVPSLGKSSDHNGCPGSRMIDHRHKSKEIPQGSREHIASQLIQWPIQLTLVNPSAPYFDSEELLVAADCVPFAYADFHNRFLSGKPIVIFCPKLDGDIEKYVVKLSEILRLHPIKKIGVLRMEVPCCGGTTMIAEKAVQSSGKSILIHEHIISLDGNIVESF